MNIELEWNTSYQYQHIGSLPNDNYQYFLFSINTVFIMKSDES